MVEQLLNNPTVKELKAYSLKYYLSLINDLIFLAYAEVEKRYSEGVQDAKGRKLYFDFARKLRKLREHEKPWSLYSEFHSKIAQGDFLDYRRKDCETIRTVKNREATRAKRAQNEEEVRLSDDAFYQEFVAEKRKSNWVNRDQRWGGDPDTHLLDQDFDEDVALL